MKLLHYSTQQCGLGPRRMATPQCSAKSQAFSTGTATLKHGQELGDSFSGLDAGTGQMTVAGFGSLLSERSARSTFPDLQDFRPGRIFGFKRVFAHTADIFFERGIANLTTREIGSLSCEPCNSPCSDPQQPLSGSSSSITNSSSSGSNLQDYASSSSSSHHHGDQSLVVSLFEVPFTPDNVAAFIQREHEFRFLAVQAYDLSGKVPEQKLAVLCGANTDQHYKATRCPPDEWQQRWGVHGISSVWSDDVLPCRVYLRHCVLAAKGFCTAAHDSFMNDTYLSDRVTTIREYLQLHPEIMDELPPPDLIGRYSG